MRIYKLKKHYSLGGRDVNNTHTCDFLFRSEREPGDPAFVVLANNLDIAIKKVWLEPTTSLRSVISLVKAPNGARIPRNMQTTVYHNSVGEIVLGDDDYSEITEKCVFFSKEANMGTPGGFALRGALLEGDTASTERGNLIFHPDFDTTKLTTLANALEGIFNGQACPLILPAPRSKNFVNDVRLVSDVKLVGPGLLQKNNNRRSYKEEEDSLIRRSLNEIQQAWENVAYDENGVGTPALSALRFLLASRKL
jgi:hypothetical protein